MKKMLFLLIAIFCVSTMMNAQVCKISNSNDNIEVYSCELTNNNTVTVTVGNDSQDISANVTVTIEVVYGRSDAKTFSAKGLAGPNRTTEIKISIPSENKQGSSPSAVKVTSISGTKCL